MEEALLGQKQIREYFKGFSEQQWNKVAKATMLLGIQSLMKKSPSAVAGDFSSFSLEELENLVAENEVKLMHHQRQQRVARSRSRGAEGRGDDQRAQQVQNLLYGPDNNNASSSPSRTSVGSSAEKKKVKRVTVVEDSVSSANQEQKQQQQRQESPQAVADANQPTCSSSPEEAGFINVNRRHQREFNKQKSSTAMKTLLKADEQTLFKQQIVVAGSQITSKLDFENKRDGRAPGPSILKERSGSREQSRERASSRWRRGVTQTSLERQAEESARKAIASQAQTMQYPSWWQGGDQIEEQRDQQAQPPTVDPARARVHKNLHRYAEDSLDARIRQVQSSVPAQQQEEGINLSRQPWDGGQQNENGSAALQNQLKEEQFSSIDQNQYQNRQSMISSQTQLMNSLQKMPNNQGSPAPGLQETGKLTRTFGSQSSFAYTSNKHVPKYSPVRGRDPGSQNTPMSYTGPPTQDELNRNAGRQESGNRNFTINIMNQQPGSQQRQPKAADRTVDDRHRQQKGGQKQNQRTAVAKHGKKGSANNSSVQPDAKSFFLQQQRETQQNRMKNQELLDQTEQPRGQEDGGEDDGGMRRYARGGIALTIASAPEEERQRSGSQPRYPYMDQEPFQGPSQERNHPSSYVNQSQDQNQQRYGRRPETASNKRLPKELSNIESTIKSKVDYDRRMFLEKQRIMEARQYQQDQIQDSQDPNMSQGIQPQIFYKKDDSKVMYEEGQETYRGPQNYYQDAAEQENPPSHNMNEGQGASLRRRKVSPQTQGAIQRQNPQMQAPNDYRELQRQQSSAYDMHNETGFTNKLNHQNQYQSDVRNQQQQRNQPDPRFSAGSQIQPDESYYQHDYQNGAPGLNPYAAQSVPSGFYRGQDRQEATYQEGDSQESSANKNNTSRFAFSNDHEQYRQGMERQGQALNNSTFNDQSLVVTPNLSQGGHKLQNQLEQVLMMKSGEFSAGGPMAGREFDHPDRILQNSDGRSYQQNADESQGNINDLQDQRQRMQHPSYPETNYGNPNFMPPQQHLSGSQGSFNRDAYADPKRSQGELRDQQQDYPDRDGNYYKSQYPATFQQFEHNGSSHKNFATSQFAGNEMNYQQQNHSKTNSQADLKNSRMNAQTASAVADLHVQERINSQAQARMSGRMNNGANFTLQRNSGVDVAPAQEPEAMGLPKKHSQESLRGVLDVEKLRDTRDGQYRETVNKRARYYNQDQQYQPSQPQPNQPDHHRISSGRKYQQVAAQPAQRAELTKNYQTFNDDDSTFINQQQQQQQPVAPQGRADDYSEELSDYPGEEMGSSLGDDGEMGQATPSRSSPMKDSDFEHTRTEQIRNFMDQAQPAGNMLDSQGNMGSSTFIDNRKMAPPGAILAGESQGGTDEKEGGSYEDQRASTYSLNKHGALQHGQPDSRHQLQYQHPSESSPELSGTNQLSASSRQYASSSLQDSPESHPRGAANEKDLLQNLNVNAQQITQQLAQMQQRALDTPSKEQSGSRKGQESESLSPLPDSEL